jgi:fused signal recognition particle receptor
MQTTLFVPTMLEFNIKSSLATPNMFKFWKRNTPTDSSAATPATLTANADLGVQSKTPSTWTERLRSSSLGRTLSSVFSANPRLDEDLLEKIETILLSSDIGVSATQLLIDSLRQRMQAREFAHVQALFDALRELLLNILKTVNRPLHIDSSHRPFVLMVVGVNGVGKTTTIGKLAQHFKKEGALVMLAAGDTFRAAAVEQLSTWGLRNDVAVVAQSSGSDSASVIFDALQAAKARNVDILIADTAGRLHTQTGLMQELGKIRRVLSKLDAQAPHEVLQVIDATTGQNAINQVRQFHEAVGVTGLVVTKLDGSAKGGVLFALAKEFSIPIRYVGLGESLDDLRVFDAEAFVHGLLPNTINS